MENKLTDNEIKKAIGLCNGIPYCACDECAYQNNTRTDCVEVLAKDTLDLINRLEAENQKLKAQVHRLKQYDEERDIALHARLIATARAEAVKEYVKQLKENLDISVYGYSSEEVTQDIFDTIDNTAEEMVGKGND